MDGLKCGQCSLINPPSAISCERCGSVLQLSPVITESHRATSQDPQSYAPLAQPVIQRDPYQCWKCGGRFMQDVENPNKGTGCIVALIGFIFAPACIGIPILIYGFVMMNEKKIEWCCRSCGLRLPAE